MRRAQRNAKLPPLPTLVVAPCPRAVASPVVPPHLQWIDRAAMDLDNVASGLGPAYLSRPAQLREAADRLADLATLGMAFCAACGAIVAAQGGNPGGWAAARDAHLRGHPEARQPG